MAVHELTRIHECLLLLFVRRFVGEKYATMCHILMVYSECRASKNGSRLRTRMNAEKR